MAREENGAQAPPFLSTLATGLTAAAPGLWFLSFLAHGCLAGAEAAPSGPLAGAARVMAAADWANEDAVATASVMHRSRFLII
jgi:hypothetical protein